MTVGEAMSEAETDVKQTGAPTEPPTAGETQDEARQETEQQTPRVFTQEEVDKLVQKRLAKESRRYERRLAEVAASAAKQAAPEPQREEFATDEEHQQAKLRHTIAREAERIAESKVREQAQKSAQEASMTAFWDRADEVAERFPDFHSAVRAEGVPIHGHILDFVLESQTGPEVAYWLAKNVDDAQRIAAMSPVKAVMKLMQVEAELKAKPQQRISKAPDPMTPVNKGRAAASAMPSDDDDIETWMAKERARQAKRN